MFDYESKGRYTRIRHRSQLIDNQGACRTPLTATLANRLSDYLDAGWRTEADLVRQIRKELTAIIRWDKAQFTCDTPTEVAAIRFRAARKSELLQQAREIAQMN